MALGDIDRLHQIEIEQLPGVGQVARDLLDDLNRCEAFRGGDRRQLGVVLDAGFEAIEELWVSHVESDREDATGSFVSLFDDVAIVVTGIEADRFVELRALDIADVHRREDRQQEEAAPEASFPAVDGPGHPFHHGIEEVAMTVFVLAPVFEKPENRIDPVLGVLLHVTENGDVAPVADFLRQVGRVENVLGLKEGVVLVGRQEAEVELEPEVAHRFIEEACVAGFVAGHQGKAFGEKGVFSFEFFAQLLIEEESRKLRGAGLLQELDEDLAGLWIEVVGGPVKLGGAHEVVAVVVGLKFLDDRPKLIFVGRQVHLRHRVEVGGVEARRQDCVLFWGFNAGPQVIGDRFAKGIYHSYLLCLRTIGG